MVTKIWINTDFINKEGCDVPFLFPLIETPLGEINYCDKSQINGWKNFGRKYIGLVEDISDCDIVVFPKNFSMRYIGYIDKLCKKAKEKNKKVIIFYLSDNEKKLKIDNAIIFRSSLNSNKYFYEYPLPGFPEDLHSYIIASETSLQKKDISIGYTGYAGYHDFKSKLKFYVYKCVHFFVNTPIIEHMLYNLYRYILHNEKSYTLISVIGTGRICRDRVIKQLMKEQNIDFKFIQRTKGFGIHDDNVKKEYIENLVNCDFPLVVRGFGNFSFRLSEVMSLGKIPLFIDTDCILPFSEKIKYKDLFIRVPYSEIHNIGTYISSYLKKNSENLNKIQYEIRKIYETYYTLTGYYVHILDIINQH